jgi:hypothetical protein
MGLRENPHSGGLSGTVRAGMAFQAWTRRHNKGTIDVMRVDNPEEGHHDHGFGQGAVQPEHHDIGLGVEQGIDHDTASHGMLDHIGQGAEAAALGGHADIGHLDHDFGHDGLHDGLDGLHDSVHHSIGLGFEGDQHHSLHDGLHDVQHDAAHDTHHDGADLHHDIGGLFH